MTTTRILSITTAFACLFLLPLFANGLGFSSIFGLLAMRNKRMSDVFEYQCKVAKRRGLLHPDGRSWTPQEVQDQIHEEIRQKKNPFLRTFE
mmetsp:Transcript_4237/g.5581  ORF Transcript_4237/g.5581 Transcript_4237/m.5581 type:complete len:92 (+) Transcript_4237:145-420(+)